MFLTVSDAVELVDHRHELVFFLFHIPYYIYYSNLGDKGTHFPRKTSYFARKNLKKTYISRLFDLRQQKGCVRTQFGVNACVNQKNAVPLHRQKT
jgi:hypothetical protein